MRRMIKYLAGVVILLFAILVIYVKCIQKEDSTFTFNIPEISEIYVIDGNNGDIMEVTDEKDINKVAEYMKNIEFDKAGDVEPWGGFSYNIKFVDGNAKETQYIFGTSYVTIDGDNFAYTNANKNSLEKLWNELSASTFSSSNE